VQLLDGETTTVLRATWKAAYLCCQLW